MIQTKTLLYYKRTFKVTLLVLFIGLVIILNGCRKKRTEIAKDLFKKTHNKVFKDITEEGFAEAFKKEIKAEGESIPNIDIISIYYQQNEYEPTFVLKHLFNGDLDKAAEYFEKADEHGLNKKIFKGDSLKMLLDKFRGKNVIKTVNQAYSYMAKIEIIASSSFFNYSYYLQYGVVNPRKLFQRYYLNTKEPDSSSMLKVFKTSNIPLFLKNIQPIDTQYTALQKALKSNVASKGFTSEELERIILVNMERLRWQNKPTADKYVVVNIPDYMLNVIDSGHSVLSMKVCVGEGRNIKNQNTVLAYNDTAIQDKPFPRETPLLNSNIYCVEVNPVWNIPRSIATKEIIVDAAKDRFYLANKNIEVYKNGKLINNPEEINWAKVNKLNNDYEFKQKPGADNSLGKIKFLFKNKSSVYLHDTPAKYAFLRNMRSVSHGCVRLGDPQALALNLFGEGEKYKTIAEDMAKDNPTPTTIYLPKRVPVYINYLTCWLDEKNELQFRKDVYGLDIVLYNELKPYLID